MDTDDAGDNAEDNELDNPDMNGCKLSAVGEEQHKEKGKDIAHGGTPPFRNRVVAYMKKELHRHYGDVSTALNFCMEL